MASYEVLALLGSLILERFHSRTRAHPTATHAAHSRTPSAFRLAFNEVAIVPAVR